MFVGEKAACTAALVRPTGDFVAMARVVVVAVDVVGEVLEDICVGCEDRLVVVVAVEAVADADFWRAE